MLGLGPVSPAQDVGHWQAPSTWQQTFLALRLIFLTSLARLCSWPRAYMSKTLCMSRPTDMRSAMKSQNPRVFDGENVTGASLLSTSQINMPLIRRAGVMHYVRPATYSDPDHARIRRKNKEVNSVSVCVCVLSSMFLYVQKEHTDHQNVCHILFQHKILSSSSTSSRQ